MVKHISLEAGNVLRSISQASTRRRPNAEIMLASVCKIGPTLSQHWFKVPRLRARQNNIVYMSLTFYSEGKRFRRQTNYYYQVKSNSWQSASVCSMVCQRLIHYLLSLLSKTRIPKHTRTTCHIKFNMPEFVSYLGERGVLCVGNGWHFCTPVLMNMSNIKLQVLRLSIFVFNKCS